MPVAPARCLPTPGRACAYVVARATCKWPGLPGDLAVPVPLAVRARAGPDAAASCVCAPTPDYGSLSCSEETRKNSEGQRKLSGEHNRNNFGSGGGLRVPRSRRGHGEPRTRSRRRLARGSAAGAGPVLTVRSEAEAGGRGGPRLNATDPTESLSADTMPAGSAPLPRSRNVMARARALARRPPPQQPPRPLSQPGPEHT